MDPVGLPGLEARMEKRMYTTITGVPLFLWLILSLIAAIIGGIYLWQFSRNRRRLFLWISKGEFKRHFRHFGETDEFSVKVMLRKKHDELLYAYERTDQARKILTAYLSEALDHRNASTEESLQNDLVERTGILKQKMTNLDYLLALAYLHGFGKVAQEFVRK